MAKTTIMKSDLSGEMIDNESEAVTITVKGNGTVYTGDAKLEEVAELIQNFRTSKPRGRKAASK